MSDGAPLGLLIDGLQTEAFGLEHVMRCGVGGGRSETGGCLSAFRPPPDARVSSLSLNTLVGHENRPEATLVRPYTMMHPFTELIGNESFSGFIRLVSFLFYPD